MESNRKHQTEKLEMNNSLMKVKISLMGSPVSSEHPGKALVSLKKGH
jgi:hypothetical protein